MATARTDLSAFDLSGARLGRRSLRRLGAGLLTDAAASLSLVLAPTSAAAEPGRRTTTPRA
jgi:hypothetical protein